MLTHPALIIALTAAFVVGFSKSGFKGIGFLFVTLMALSYGSKPSTGILLPLLILADTIAIIYYRKDVDWSTLVKIIPPMIIGVLIGVMVGEELSVEVFRYFMATIILFSGIMMALAFKFQKDRIPQGRWFAWAMGLAAGFATMIGNLAGPFANLYFLAMRFEKKAFIGTAAWLFFFINIFKLPFHICIWETVTVYTLTENVKMIPFVIIGFFVGARLIRFFSNELFAKYIMVMTILGGLLILLK